MGADTALNVLVALVGDLSFLQQLLAQLAGLLSLPLFTFLLLLPTKAILPSFTANAST